MLMKHRQKNVSTFTVTPLENASSLFQHIHNIIFSCLCFYRKNVTCCLVPEVASDWLHLALTWANTILQRFGKIIVGAGWSCPHRLEIQQAQKGCLIYTHVLVPKVSCHSHMYTHTHTHTHTAELYSTSERRLSNGAIPAVVKPAGLRLYESVTVEL